MTGLNWYYALVSVFIVSSISLIGVLTLSFSTRRLSRIILYLVSFATGSLFGGAFIHLLPEAYQRSDSHLGVSLLLLAGILIFFSMEKFFRWRHCHLSSEEDHLHPLVPMNLFGDALHNLIDGILIGVSYTINIPLGIATSLAVLFHEIPQEIGDFGILIHGGLAAKKALVYNFLSSLTAVAGTLLALILGNQVEGFAQTLIPITAGGFIYIAGSDLIPELHHHTQIRTSLFQFLFLLLGISTMVVLYLGFNA